MTTTLRLGCGPHRGEGWWEHHLAGRVRSGSRRSDLRL